MSPLAAIILVLLVGLFVFGLPVWPYSRAWKRWPAVMAGIAVGLFLLLVLTNTLRI